MAGGMRHHQKKVLPLRRHRRAVSCCTGRVLHCSETPLSAVRYRALLQTKPLKMI